MENSHDLPANEHVPESSPDQREPLVNLSNTLDEITSVAQDLDKVELSPERTTRLEEIKNKIIKSTRRFIGISKRAVAIGAVIGLSGTAGAAAVGGAVQAIGFETSHPALAQTVDANGLTAYSHPDERTAHYLNILAGKDRFTDEDLKFANEDSRTAEDLNKIAGFEKLTDDDVEKIEKGVWEKQLEDTYARYSLPLPANLDQMSSVEMGLLSSVNPDGSFNSEESKASHRQAIIYFEQQMRELYNQREEFRSTAGNDLYDLVWNLEKECGNPRIRFIGEDNIPPISSTGREFYVSVNNTMYIVLDDLTGDTDAVEAEMSHAKQDIDHPVDFLWRSTRDNVEALTQGILSGKGYRKAYDGLLYNKSGSVEYEAHKVIQPELEKKYPITPFKDMEKNTKNLK